MPPFIVNTHGRLQEWIAHEKGYFKQAGLENYTLAPHSILTKSSPKKVHTISHIENDKMGAYQTYEKGREASISCACHWTVNMAASDNHGRLWGECYSVSPCAVVVSNESSIHSPEDLAGVEVHVGYQSGSHYTTIQALEPFLEPKDIKLKFGGTPSDRIDQLLDKVAPAATVFGPQLYMAEQLGFRKVLDCTFMTSAMIPEGADFGQITQYYEALRLAQADIDQMHQPYVHYYLNELPERHAKLVDVKRFGPGERIVFEPYSRDFYESTQTWILERGIFNGANVNRRSYDEAVVRA